MTQGPDQALLLVAAAPLLSVAGREELAIPVASGSKGWVSRHHKKTEVTWKEVDKLRILACNKTPPSLASCQHMASFGDYLQARAVRLF